MRLKMKRKMKRKKISNLLAILSVALFLVTCNSQKLNSKQQEYNDKRKSEFKDYLITKKIPFTTVNDSIFNAYYSDFLDDELKLKLEENPHLKINKVYVHYRTPTSVEFSIYSDKGTVCLSTFDLDIDNKILSFPENGIIKILEPIKVEDFGNFEINGNVIKTRKRQLSPFNETYYYVNGTVNNDTIHYTERYVGKEKKFEKKTFFKTYKEDFKEIYQPGLKAVQYKQGKHLVSYIVTGEFKVESP